MSEFERLWYDVMRRSQRGVMTVQNREELEHVYEMTRGCKTYLEVGTAEGNTLHVLGHNMDKIVCVDLCEPHTKVAREEVQGHARIIAGNSHDHKIINLASGLYDFILIDAGHTFPDVIADAMSYGWMARKYIIFHDVTMPEVNAAFDWYVAQQKPKNAYKFIRSTEFGYGIIEL